MSIILRHKRFNHTRKRSVLQQGSFQDLFISSIATSGLQSNKHQLKQKHVSQECSLLNLRSSWNHHCWCHRPFAIVGTTTISQSLLASTSGNGRNGSQRQIYPTSHWYAIWESSYPEINWYRCNTHSSTHHSVSVCKGRSSVQKNWQYLVI